MDVGQAREAAPENFVSRQAVVFASEVAAEFGDGDVTFLWTSACNPDPGRGGIGR